MEAHHIQQILEEVQALRSEINVLRSQVDEDKPRKFKNPKKKLKVEKVCCKGITGKGTPCQNSAVAGKDFCRMHGERPVKLEKPKRFARKPPKMKKIQPTHTHRLGVEDPSCVLCGTHGDVLDPTLDRARFWGGPSECTVGFPKLGGCTVGSPKLGGEA